MRIIPLILIGLVIIFCTFVSVPIYVSNDCNFPQRGTSETKLGLPWKRSPCPYIGVMWGKSLLEYGSDLKCLIDKQGFCFLFGSCQEIGCKPTVPSQITVTAVYQLIKNGCTSFSNGCNTCDVKSYSQMMCDLIPCNAMHAPTCLEYKK